jgi:hypothetical protein
VVEGARLESVYRGNSIEGSNPSLSANLESITYNLLNGVGGANEAGLRRKFRRPRCVFSIVTEPVRNAREGDFAGSVENKILSRDKDTGQRIKDSTGNF